MAVNAGYWIAGASLASTAAAVHQGEQSRKAQSRAGTQVRQQAAKAEAQQTREVNAANSRAPNIGALMAANQLPGGSGTLLNGPQGIDPSALTLGRNSLLGGGG